MALRDLPAFGPEDSVRVVIESPRGSGVKLKYDPALDAITLSRPLIEGVTYPYDWGFVPSTRAGDGDPVDALVVWDRSSYPGVVIPCRLLAVLAVEQNSRTRPGVRERNDRLVAVPLKAPRFDGLRDLDDLPVRLRDELEQFFLAVTAFEGKALAVLGWSGAEAALDLVRQSLLAPAPAPAS